MARGPRLAALAGLWVTGSAAAFPDGAPWGAADADAAEHCGTCHFGSDPVSDSDALSLSGWPETLDAERVYALVLRFEADGAATAGAQVLVRSAGAEAGAFVAVPADMETDGAKARTTRPRQVGDGPVAWKLEWRAPGASTAPVTFCAGAAAANDDASAFGDILHFRCFEAGPEPRAEPGGAGADREDRKRP
ncbi:MAG TPA: choice-of-anchor V domain-containing protein [Woeseiaceae bacterium]|nr:choice-of-anchor V domain-containing protein [Woeseiaceae bacterium]